jgi:hypothetical protein
MLDNGLGENDLAHGLNLSIHIGMVEQQPQSQICGGLGNVRPARPDRGRARDSAEMCIV